MIFSYTMLYSQEDVRIFTDLYFKDVDRDELDPIIDEAKDRYKLQLTEEQQIKFLQNAKQFNRIYAFLSKVISFLNLGWERLYWFLKFLITKIKPEETEDLAKGILEAIDLENYDSKKGTTTDIDLQGGYELDPDQGTGASVLVEPEMEYLDQIIKNFNDRFDHIEWMQEEKVRKV